MAERRSTLPPAIGIDLGTTNSCVGFWQNGWVKIIPNQHGNKTTPSFVAFTDARRYTGEDAEHQATTNPCNTILNVKRLIGKRFSSHYVQNDMELLPFKVVAGPGDQAMISVHYKGEEKHFSALEIYSMILRQQRDIAEAFLGCPIKNAVISVPACFNDSERLATVHAARIAGLNVMRIINEPTAAAIAYGLGNMNDYYGGSGKKKNNILIFDFGGGSLNVSIVAVERGDYKVKATVGDPHLGGVDLDNQLIRHCIEELKRVNNLNEVNLSSKALAKLRSKCESAKKILSTVFETHMQIDSLLPGGIDFDYCITRTRFEELNKGLFHKSIDIVYKCLLDANMYRSSIDDVVLIGGSSRIPMVQQMLQEFFEGKELSKRINSDEAVACGSAIQAAILGGMMSDEAPVNMVHDITNHSLGANIGKKVIRIPRNTSIPTTEEVVLNADQIKFPLKVYEGEKTRIQDNYQLGKFALKNAISVPHHGIVRIAVCFNVDENGIFNITVEDKMVTGQRKIDTIQITNEHSMSIMSGEEIEKMAANAEKLKLEEDKYKQKMEAKNALETLVNHLSKIFTNEKMYTNYKPEKKLRDAIEKIMQWLEKNPPAGRDDRFVEQYREHVSYLEKALAQAGVNLQTFPPPPGTGMMTDSDTSHVVQLESRVQKLSELTRDLALSSPHSGQGPPSCVGRKKMKDKQEKNPQAMLEESDGQ